MNREWPKPWVPLEIDEARYFDPTPLEGEEWRPVVGYEGYDVSSMGRVRTWWPGNRIRNRGPFIRTPGFLPKGYLIVILKGGGSPAVHRLVHRLVLDAFVGPCPTGHEGSHLDGHKVNCRLANLAWETPGANNARKREHGTLRIGENHPTGRLNREAGERVAKAYLSGEADLRQAGAREGVTWAVAQGVVRKRRGKHLGISVDPSAVPPAGFYRRGERNGAARFTREQVRQIRIDFLVHGKTLKEIVTSTGAGRSTICGILYWYTWQDTDADLRSLPRPRRGPRKRIDAAAEAAGTE